MINVHATLVNFLGKGILLLGNSGSGKSDLALRLITDHNAFLVADDRVEIVNNNNQLIGKAPDILFGKLEVRGIGICNYNAMNESPIDLCIELVNNFSSIERIPQEEYQNFLGINIPKIKLCAFECSIICKIIAKISGNISSL